MARKLWVMGHEGHGSVHWWVRWVMGHKGQMAHGSHNVTYCQLCAGGTMLHRVSKNFPPLAYYNFVTHERISIFMAEMLPIKQAIKRRFTMPPHTTCASALSGKTGQRENHIFI